MLAIALVVVLGLLAPQTAAAAPPMSVSGTATSDEAGTTWSQCDGVTANVAVVVDAVKYTGSCDGTTGAFWIDTFPVGSNVPVVVFLDPAASGDQGVTYTRNVDATTGIAGVTVTTDHVRIRSESGIGISPADIDTYDATQDADIPAASNGADLSAPGDELLVESSGTFAAAGDVQVGSLDVRGTFTGAERGLLELTAGGTGACTAGPGTQRPLCVSGGTFHAGRLGTTRFVIGSTSEIEGAAYEDLEIHASGGSPTARLGASGSTSLRVNGSFTVGDGATAVTADTTTWSPSVTVRGDLTVDTLATLSGSGSGTIRVEGETTGAGTVSVTGGAFTQRPRIATSRLGSTSGAANWTLPALQLTNGRAWGSGYGWLSWDGGASDGGTAIVADASGNTYLGGFTNNTDWVIRRYSDSGGLDWLWGTLGSVTFDSGGGATDSLTALAVDAQGYLYAAGWIGSGGNDWALRKYDPSGALVEGFGNVDTGGAGTNDTATYDSGGSVDDRAMSLAIDPAGYVYVGGSIGSNSGDLAVRRYRTDGTLDTTWGNVGGGACTPTPGMVCFDSGGGAGDVANAIVLDDARNVYAVGRDGLGTTNMIVRRYTAAGALDTGWGASGQVSYDSGAGADAARGAAFDAAGNLYVAGYVATNGGDLVVRRYDPSGTLTEGFGTTDTGGAGTNDTIVYDSGGGSDFAAAVALDGSDNVYVAGGFATNGGDLATRRYTSAGALDTTWGSGTGMVTASSAGSALDAAQALMVDSDGTMRMAGTIATSSGNLVAYEYDRTGSSISGDTTVRPPTGGTGTLTVGSLQVGAGGDTNLTTLDLETNDRNLDVDGSVTITSKGILSASSTAAFTIGDDFTRQGTFTPNTGTVTFDTASNTSTLTYVGDTTFYNVRVATPSKAVLFDESDQTNITGTTGTHQGLSVNGGSCTNSATIGSAVPGDTAPLNVTGTQDLRYATILDLAPGTPLTATVSINGGNNTAGLTLASKCVSVNGTAFADEGSTKWAQCDGTTLNIAASFNGGVKERAACSAVDGSYSVLVGTASTDGIVTVYLDPGTPGDKGALYIRNSSVQAAIGTSQIYRDHVRIDSQTSTRVTNRDLDTYDSAQDSDIPVTIDGSGAFTASSGIELQVAPATTFAPGGDVTTSSLHLRTNSRFVAAPFSTLTLTGSGSGACANGPATQRPLCDAGTKQFVAGTGSTVRFTGTSNSSFDPQDYANVSIKPTSGSPNFTIANAGGDMTVSGTLDVGTGASTVTLTKPTSSNVTIAGDLLVNTSATLSGTGTGTITVGGDMRGGGTVNVTAGTFEHRPRDTSATLGSTSGAALWRYGALVASNGSTWGTSGGATVDSGTGADSAAAVVRAPDGSTYVGGTLAAASGSDFVIRKYTASGALDTSWGNANSGCAAATPGVACYSSAVGANDDRVLALAVGVDGSLYAAGSITAGVQSDLVVRKYTPAGALDTSWGNTHVGCATGNVAGMACYSTGVGTGDEAARAIAVDASGSAFVAGYQSQGGSRDLIVRRYTPTGALDTSWGGSNTNCSTGAVAGMACYSSAAASGNDDEGAAIAVTGDGAVVVAGFQTTGDHDLVALRFTAAGALDTSWGDTQVDCSGGSFPGMVCYSSAAGANDDRATSLALAPDGTLYVGGTQGAGAGDMIVRRYTAAGALDTGWGNTNVDCSTGAVPGMVCYSSAAASANDDRVSAISLVATGGLVVTGTQGTGGGDAVVRRYSSSGALDTTWGGGHVNCGGGVAGTVCYGSAAGVNDDGFAAVAPLGDGSVVVAGSQGTNSGDWVVRKYTRSGAAATGTTTIRAASGGTGQTRAVSMQVGSASDAADTALDLETNDRVYDDDGSLTIATRGALQVSSSAAFTVGDDFTNDGTFTASAASTMTFDTAGNTATLQYAGATTFGNLVMTGASKIMEFDATDLTTVAGTLTTSSGGNACGTLQQLRSVVGGNAFDISIGTAAITYTRITDSNVTNPTKNATLSESGGGNSGWNITTGACTSLSFTVPSGASETLSPAAIIPGTDASASTTLDIVTNNATGYSVTATDASNAWGMDRVLGGDTMDDFPDAGSDGIPDAWGVGTSGSNGMFGITVLDATGGRLAKWGAGSTTETDFATNLYRGLGVASYVMHSTAGPASNDLLEMAYRATPSGTTTSGDYATSVTFTVTANP